MQPWARSSRGRVLVRALLHPMRAPHHKEVAASCAPLSLLQLLQASLHGPGPGLVRLPLHRRSVAAVAVLPCGIPSPASPSSHTLCSPFSCLGEVGRELGVGGVPARGLA
jgi:hypothetical protein